MGTDLVARVVSSIPLLRVIMLLVVCLLPARVILHAADDSSRGPSLALVGGTVYPVASSPIEDGVVIVEDGRITAVGAAADVKIPAGAHRIDACGMSVIPGLVDASSGLLRRPGELPPSVSSAALQVFDVLDPLDSILPLLRREGITTIGVSPVTRGAVKGVGSVFRLGGHDGLELRTIAASLHLELGVAKVSFGPATSSNVDRLAQYYRLRKLLLAARKYGKTWDDYREAVKKYNTDAEAWRKQRDGAEEKKDQKKNEKKNEKTDEKTDQKKTSDGKLLEQYGFRMPPSEKPPEKKPPEKPIEKKPPALPKRPKFDPGNEVLQQALLGRLPVFVRAHRRDDIEHALRLAGEFDLSLVLLGVTEGYCRAGALQEAKVPVVVGPVLLSRWGVELLEHRESNCSIMAAAGVAVAIGGVSLPGASSRYLRLQAAVAVRGGLSRELALRAVTLESARCLGVADRVGSIEPGKDADLVLVDGDPLDATSSVRRVLVGGKTVYPAQERF